jgi:uncharacterized membrane protein YgdD (TMEM256/DUF423 family)
MNQRTTLLVGIGLAGLAVVFGAFGSHALKTTLSSSGRTETYELAVRYQFYHAFALAIAGLLMNQFQASSIRYAAVCFTGGVIFFSGSLYLLAVTGTMIHWSITPLGGLLFIAGWILLFLGILKK